MAPILKVSLANRLTIVLGLLAHPASASIRKAGCEARALGNVLAGSGVGVMLKSIGGGKMVRPALSCACKRVAQVRSGREM